MSSCATWHFFQSQCYQNSYNPIKRLLNVIKDILDDVAVAVDFVVVVCMAINFSIK